MYVASRLILKETGQMSSSQETRIYWVGLVSGNLIPLYHFYREIGLW